MFNAAGKTDVEHIDTLKDWSFSKYITLTSPLLRNTNKYGLLGGMVKNAVDFVVPNIMSLPKGASVRWAFFVPSKYGLQEITRLTESEKVG